MVCIWCLLERPERAGREHVVAKAMGGSFTIPRVCLRCDNSLGAFADDPLIGHFAMLVKRASLGLKGQRGVAPDVMATLLARTGTATDDSTFRVDIRASSAERTFGLRVRPRVDVDVKIDGDNISVAVNALRVDASEPKGAESLFKAVVRGKGVTNEETLDTLWRAVAPHVVDISERRSIDIPFEYRTEGHRAGLVKIAYELAWHWLGDSWLDDPIAAEMRRCTLAGEDGSPLLLGTVRDADEIRASRLQVRDGDRRSVAVLLPYSRGYAVMLRLLNVFEALLFVAEDASAYRHPERDALVMDAVARTNFETNFQALFGVAEARGR